MEAIRREDIEGARIARIHSTFSEADGLNFTVIYFTVDRGFSFTLPAMAGQAWFKCEVPAEAVEEEDEREEGSFKIQRNWFGMVKFIPQPPRKIDWVKRIKQRTIVGIFCDRAYQTHILILFDDGSQAHCLVGAPDGVGGGLFWDSKEQGAPVADLVNFFELPRRQ